MKYFIEINLENKEFYRIYQYINDNEKIRYKLVEVNLEDNKINEKVLKSDLCEMSLKNELKYLLEKRACFLRMEKIMYFIKKEMKKDVNCYYLLRLEEINPDFKNLKYVRT